MFRVGRAALHTLLVFTPLARATVRTNPAIDTPAVIAKAGGLCADYTLCPTSLGIDTWLTDILHAEMSCTTHLPTTKLPNFICAVVRGNFVFNLRGQVCGGQLLRRQVCVASRVIWWDIHVNLGRIVVDKAIVAYVSFTTRVSSCVHRPLLGVWKNKRQVVEILLVSPFA